MVDAAVSNKNAQRYTDGELARNPDYLEVGLQICEWSAVVLGSVQPERRARSNHADNETEPIF